MPDADRPDTVQTDRPRFDGLVSGIRDMIVEGELAPGSRVPERVLCERFGVSRTPLREALKVLANDGLIELLPNRGARIVALTEDDIEDMFQVMGALESLAGELSARRITDLDLAELRALHYQMALHFTRGERMPYFRLNQQIHEKIFAASGNRTLVNVYRGLAGRLRRARYIANISRERWSEAVEEHERLLAALEARDGAMLGRLLKEHLRKTCETARRSLAPVDPRADAMPAEIGYAASAPKSGAGRASSALPANSASSDLATPMTKRSS